jgi:hypothetical protein
MRALLELQHLDEAAEPLAWSGRQHLRDLVLPGHGFSTDASEARVVGRSHRDDIGRHRERIAPCITKRSASDRGVNQGRILMRRRPDRR